MQISRKVLFGAAVCVFAGLTTGAQADSLTLNFDTAAGSGLSNGSTSSSIQTYMQNVLNAAGLGATTVNVSGAVEQQGASSYAGEGYVVGPQPGGYGHTVYPLTLANTNGSTTPNMDTSKWDSNPPTLSNMNPDGFIKNCTGVDSGSSCPGGNSNGILVTFSTGLSIQSISFDLQIFPDGSCPSASNCGSGQANWPDFKLYVNNAPVETWLGIDPGAMASATYEHSNKHKYSSKETAPQLLTTSGDIDVSADPVTTLYFADWPATIGIDNLTFNFPPPPPPPPQHDVPAPPALSLFLLGLGGLGFMRRRRRVA